MNMDEKIDIVIPWVDGNDPVWKKEKEEWTEKENPSQAFNSNNRYQDWGNLRYLFRAIEKNLPWFNKIVFVTYGHIPDFLDTAYSRVEVIRHDEFIPKEYLPTFNVNTIELNLHRIENLCEHFIYFNDDTFPIGYIDKEYFFDENIPCDEAIETPIIPTLSGELTEYVWNIRGLDTAIINKHFDKREIQKKYPEKWFNECYGELLERNKSLSYWNNFVGFHDPHMPNAFCKSSFKTVWNEEHAILDSTCKRRFRNFSNVNQWLVRYWQLCEGNFMPRKTQGKSYVVTKDNCVAVSKEIKERMYPMVCINEECRAEDFDFIKEQINNSLEQLFPNKSKFEQ